MLDTGCNVDSVVYTACIQDILNHFNSHHLQENHRVLFLGNALLQDANARRCV